MKFSLNFGVSPADETDQSDNKIIGHTLISSILIELITPPYLRWARAIRRITSPLSIHKTITKQKRVLSKRRDARGNLGPPQSSFSIAWPWAPSWYEYHDPTR